MNDAVARAAAAAGARLVFADNLYMYGPGSSPMTEASPQLASDDKGRLRIALAGDLLERHRRGELEVVIGRSADYFGSGGENTGLGKRVFGAALAGKSASWAGRLDVPHSSSYLPDLARAMVVLGDRDEAAGRAWHLPVMDPLTGREFLDRLYAVLGAPARIRVDGPLTVRLAGIFIPTVREFGGVLYQWSAPFVSDWSAFETAFGPFRRTQLDVALEATLAWWRERAQEAGQAVASAA